MKRAETAYRKDMPATVRLHTSFAPCDNLSIESAESLVRDLQEAIAEARQHNEKHR